MATKTQQPRIYEGQGDDLMHQDQRDLAERILLMPDALPSKVPDTTPRLRIMWGQHLLEDLLAGRYRTLVCAVNARDNASGIITQLANLLPTSQWDPQSITEHAARFNSANDKAKVLKFDMDMLEVLAILRPMGRDHLTLEDLRSAFKVVAEMVRRQPNRLPSASVSFLGARANKLVDASGDEPAFEAVLRAMYEAGYHGDVYHAPSMWHLGKTAMFARYPFSPALDRLREGGF